MAARRRPRPSGPIESVANPLSACSRPRRTGCTDTASRTSPCGGTLTGRGGCVPPSKPGRTSRTRNRARRAVAFTQRYDTSPTRPTENAGGASRKTSIAGAPGRVALCGVQPDGPDEQDIGNEHRVECPREPQAQDPAQRNGDAGRQAAAGPEKAAPRADQIP